MSVYNKFQAFVQDVGRKVHNLNSDTLKVMLTNAAPVATNSLLADLTEIAAGNGYTAGGTALPAGTYSQTGGTATLAAGGNVSFQATGGTIGPFRYAVIYNATAAGGPLIGWWDYGSTVTLNAGETFVVDLSNNVLTVT